MEENAFLAAAEELAQQVQDDSQSARREKKCKNVHGEIKMEINKTYKLKHNSSKVEFVPKNNTMTGILKSYKIISKVSTKKQLSLSLIM